MSAVAAILSIILFLLFASAGIQKIRFNPSMSQAAEHMGFTKPAYQRIGYLELVGAFGVFAGLSAKGGFWAVLNEAAAAGLLILMVAAVVLHLKKGDKVAMFVTALVFGLLSLLELIFHLAA